MRRWAVPVLALVIVTAACRPTTGIRAPSSTSAPEPSPVPSLAEGAAPGGATPSGGPTFDPRRALTKDLAWAAVARERYLPMYRQAGRKADPNFVFDTRNAVGRRAPLLVDAARRIDGRLWLRLLLPIRPNGRHAWARGGDVRLVPREDRIDVSLSRRILWHYQDGKLVDRFRVGVGTPSTPTPTGTFYLYIRVRQANPWGPYGILALGISGFSPVISDWPGGGRAAIHGTPYESNRGEAVSHGCVRVWNPDMRKLRSVPLGTPVIITP